MFKRLRRSTKRRRNESIKTESLPETDELNDEIPTCIPVYRQAIIRVCQLQLKICTKLFEIAPSNKPLRRQPKSLKQIAGVTILQPFRSSDRSPQWRRSAVERLRGILPNDLSITMRGLLVVLIVVSAVYMTVAQEKKTTTGPVRCYVCNSLNSGQQNCSSSDENELKPFLKTCPKINEGQLVGRTATSCRKILQEVHDQEGVIRECAYTGEDKPCNSASSMSIVAASIVSAVVMLLGTRL
ncbi:hypothetical protein M3Y94_00754300 [Aphelenchoides besseyi]|nr:hypothetical protein M3Y94_00754300 [Aphelenchoides besseyi]KAI6232102.1 hypothetical protein M3Y95_00451600 [Aphelenchoides besseyi]